MTDSCLPDFWSKHYRPMPGISAMVAVSTVVSIEMFFTSKGAGHTYSTEREGMPAIPSRVQPQRAGPRQGNGHISLYELDTPSHCTPMAHRKSRNLVSGDSGSEDDESATLSHRVPHSCALGQCFPASLSRKDDALELSYFCTTLWGLLRCKEFYPFALECPLSLALLGTVIGKYSSLCPCR